MAAHVKVDFSEFNDFMDKVRRAGKRLCEVFRLRSCNSKARRMPGTGLVYVPGITIIFYDIFCILFCISAEIPRKNSDQDRCLCIPAG